MEFYHPIKKILIGFLLSFLVLFSFSGIFTNHDADAASKTMYVTADTLNVRASASTKAKIITKVKKNTAVTVIQTKGNWAKVKVNKKTGWVSSKYLTSKKPVTSKIMYAKEATILKEKANDKSKTLANIKKDDSITVYSTTSGNYYKAKVGNKTGWILKSKVSDTKKVRTTVKEVIKYQSLIRYDKQVPKGKTFVSQQGKNGEREKVVEKTYKNGKLVSTKTISSKVTKRVVNKITTIGTMTYKKYLSRNDAIQTLKMYKSLQTNDNITWNLYYSKSLLAKIKIGNNGVSEMFFDFSAYFNGNIGNKLSTAVYVFTSALFGEYSDESIYLLTDIKNLFEENLNVKYKKQTVVIGGHSIEIITQNNTMTVIPK